MYHTEDILDEYHASSARYSNGYISTIKASVLAILFWAIFIGIAVLAGAI